MFNSAFQKWFTLRSGAVLLTLCVLGLLAWRWQRGTEVEFLRAVRRDFVQTVVATGHVETPHRVEVGVQVTGTVNRIPVAEGQSVKAGDLLIGLESAELVAAQRQARIAVEQARLHVRQLGELQLPLAEQSLRQARATLDNARQQLQRNEALFRKEFIGEAALQDSRKLVELNDAQYRAAQLQLDSARPGGTDFALAQEAVAQAQATAEAADARRGYAEVRASAAGVLIARNVEVGDVVQPGKALLTLSPFGQTQLVVDIDEKNLRYLAIGQPALASADAYAQQRFAARLVYINPGVNAQTAAVQIKLDVPRSPPALRQDMTVSVDIEVARHPQVVVVPLAAIHDPDGTAPWTWKVEQGRVVSQSLTLGLRSGGQAEILQGLVDGDQVVAANSGLAAGAHVHALVTH